MADVREVIVCRHVLNGFKPEDTLITAMQTPFDVALCLSCAREVFSGKKAQPGDNHPYDLLFQPSNEGVLRQCVRISFEDALTLGVPIDPTRAHPVAR